MSRNGGQQKPTQGTGRSRWGFCRTPRSRGQGPVIDERMAGGSAPARATTDGVHRSPPIRAQGTLISSATSIRSGPCASSPFVLHTFSNNRRFGRVEKRNRVLERYGCSRLFVVAYLESVMVLSKRTLGCLISRIATVRRRDLQHTLSRHRRQRCSVLSAPTATPAVVKADARHLV